jgi:hypothetical protein
MRAGYAPALIFANTCIWRTLGACAPLAKRREALKNRDFENIYFDEMLRRHSPLLNDIYALEGRPSNPARTTARGSPADGLDSVCSERPFCKRLGSSSAGGLGRSRPLGLKRTQAIAHFLADADNLLRMAQLEPLAAA